MMKIGMPLLMGLSLGVGLYYRLGWWGFLVLFPWIGLSITIGMYLKSVLPKKKKEMGRKVSILLVMPSLLFFVPMANQENLQLEGIVFLLSLGLFSKGVVHYAIAKVFGPLIWGRGFCGWACWTAAALEWLPIGPRKSRVPKAHKHIRYMALLISVGLPVVLILGWNFDVQSNYLNRQELIWMLAGNGVYYLLAIPLAFCYQDKRAFCKIACPVSLVMKIPARYALIKRRPTGKACSSCGTCNVMCAMDVDVMSYISKGQKVVSTECILCNACVAHCPEAAIR